MAKQDVNQASQTKRSPISCSSRRSWSTSQGRTPWGPAPGSSLAWRRSWLPRPIFCDKHILHICMNNSWNFHKNWMMFTCIFYVRKLASIWVSIPRAPCIFFGGNHCYLVLVRYMNDSAEKWRQWQQIYSDWGSSWEWRRQYSFFYFRENYCTKICSIWICGENVTKIRTVTFRKNSIENVS